MFVIIFLTRYYRSMSFKLCVRSIVRPVECYKTIQRNQFAFTNHLRAYAKNKLGGDPKSKMGEEKKPTLKMPGLVHPETRNEEIYYAEKSKTQLQQIKRKPDSIKIDAPDKKE